MKIKEEKKIMEQKNIYKQVKLYKTLPECLLDVQDAYAERPAITSFDRAGTQRDVSYREFVKDVQGAAYMMVQKKMAGKHIAWWAKILMNGLLHSARPAASVPWECRSTWNSRRKKS